MGAKIGRALPVKQVVRGLAERWRARAPAGGPCARGLRLNAIRSSLEAELAARLAVRSGLPLEDFLAYRVARYAVRLPVPIEALPVDIGIEAGEVAVRVRPHRQKTAACRRRDGEPDAAAAPGGGRDLGHLEATLADLARRISAARDRAEATARAIVEDLASGALPCPPASVEATPEQLGRTPVPPAAPALALRSLALALLAAEAFRLAGPAMAAVGLSGLDLVAAAAQAPIAGALGLAFSVGAAAAVFAFVRLAVDRGEELAREAPPPRRRALLGAAGAGAAALSAAVAAAASSPARWAEQVLLVAVPFAAAQLLRYAAQLSADREVAVAAALAWDQARAREAAERARRTEGLAQAEAALERLEAERQEALRQLRALERLALQEAREAERAAAAEAHGLERIAETFAAALELDRYAYLRRASARGQDALLRPVRAGRPARLEHAVTTERLGVAG